MRFSLLLIPPAVIAPALVQAEVFATIDDVQAALFPGATFTPADIVLSKGQVEELLQASRSTVLRSRVKVWKVSSGGWLFVDQVFGRDDRITYAIGIDAAGAVKGIEILVCDAGYSEVRNRRWLGQFRGFTQASAAQLVGGIANISGSTLSVDHITEGVRRVLATHALFLAHK